MRLSLRYKRTRVFAASAAVAVGAAVLVPAQSVAHAATSACPWMDATQSPDVRASELVSAMTLDQKVAELYGRGEAPAYGGANEIPAVAALCIPELIFNDAGGEVNCGIRMMLLGDRLLAKDNGYCGGMNVKFTTMYARVHR